MLRAHDVACLACRVIAVDQALFDIEAFTYTTAVN